MLAVILAGMLIGCAGEQKETAEMQKSAVGVTTEVTESVEKETEKNVPEVTESAEKEMEKNVPEETENVTEMAEEESGEEIENSEMTSSEDMDEMLAEIGTTEHYLEQIFSDTYPDIPIMRIETELLVVDKKYEGAEKINRFLREQESELIAYGEECAAEQEEQIKENEDVFGLCNYSVDSAVSKIWYFDGTYFSFCQEEYDYQGGAHGMPYRIGYAFDLQTGERLDLSDIVGNTEEEVKKIITDYVTEYINKDSESFWENAVETVEENAGFQEVTIPYSAFEMKLPIS